MKTRTKSPKRKGALAVKNQSELVVNASQKAKIIKDTELPQFRKNKNGDGLVVSGEKTNWETYLAKLNVSGSANQYFHQYVINSLVGLGPRDNPSVTEVNAAIAFIASLDPKNESECLLIVQMFTAHSLAMRFAYQASHAPSYDSLEITAKRFEKSSRLYVDLQSALAKMRGEGQQHVVVKHVSVQAGGKAIVGPINYQGRTKNEIDT